MAFLFSVIRQVTFCSDPVTTLLTTVRGPKISRSKYLNILFYGILRRQFHYFFESNSGLNCREHELVKSLDFLRK